MYNKISKEQRPKKIDVSMRYYSGCLDDEYSEIGSFSITPFDKYCYYTGLPLGVCQSSSHFSRAILEKVLQRFNKGVINNDDFKINNETWD